MRYFIDIVTDKGAVADPEGHEFTDSAEAREEAVQSLRDLLADRLRAGGYIHVGWCANVRDQKGALPFKIPARELIVEKSVEELLDHNATAVRDEGKLTHSPFVTFRRAQEATRQIKENVALARAQLSSLRQLAASLSG